MRNLFCDAETYWHKAGRVDGVRRKAYSLRQQEPTAEYIRNPLFEEHGWAVAKDEGEPVWMRPKKFRRFIRGLREKKIKYRFVAHNTRFDGLIVTEKHGVVAPAYGDTKSMARAVIGCRIRDFDLASVGEYYGMRPKGDTAEKINGLRWADMSDDLREELIEYAKDDIHICRGVFNEMLPHIPDAEMDMISWIMEMQCDPQFRLDNKALRQVIQDENDKFDEAWDSFNRTYREFYDPFPDFPVQQMKDIRGRKALPEALWMLTGEKPPEKVSKTTGKMTWAMAKDDMAFVELKLHENPVVGALVDARLKIFSTGVRKRAERLLQMGTYQEEHDIAFPVPLNYSGALNTHRLSGGDYLNMQNLTRKHLIRAAIVAKRGQQVWAADSTGIELRVGARFNPNPTLWDIIADGRDPYCETAAEIYGVPVYRIEDEDHPEHQAMEDKRLVGKVAVLQLGYQAGWRTFQKQVWSWSGFVLSNEEAKRAVGTFREMYDMKDIWKACEREILRGIFRKQQDEDETETPLSFAPFCTVSKWGLRLPSGLRLHYPSMKRRKQNHRKGLGWSYIHQGYPKFIYGGMALENLCQAVARDVVMYQGLEINKRYPVRLFVHDEVVGVVDTDEAEDAVEYAREVMAVSPDWWPEISLKGTAAYGDTYLDCK